VAARHHGLGPDPRRHRDRWGAREVKLISGIDDHSRYCVIASVVEHATGRAVCRAFLDALGRFGVPEQVLTDNGKQFTGKYQRPRPVEVLFDVICRRNGIEHLLTKIRSPTTTGKIERWHHSGGVSCQVHPPGQRQRRVRRQVADSRSSANNSKGVDFMFDMSGPHDLSLALETTASVDELRLDKIDWEVG
jgi:transposase InsO family protein